MDRGKWVIMFPEGTRSERGKSGSYKTGAARLSIATNARIVPIAVSSGRCWPRKSFRFIPGTIAVSIGQPISPRMGESSADLMERVSLWIEGEMRRIDPEAYPESERPPDARREEQRSVRPWRSGCRGACCARRRCGRSTLMTSSKRHN